MMLFKHVKTVVLTCFTQTVQTGRFDGFMQGIIDGFIVCTGLFDGLMQGSIDGYIVCSL